MHLIEFIPFLFLSISLLSLFLRNKQPFTLRNAWLISLFLAFTSAFILGQIQLIAILTTLIAYGLAWSANNLKYPLLWRWFSGILFILTSLALGLHLMPGFNSLLVMQNISFTPNALPYNLYLNIDKTLIAIFILGLWYQRPVNIQPWPSAGRSLLWMLPLLILSVIVVALLSGHIKFEPKIIDGLWLWMWANLFFTCTAEEAFFRGLIQQQLVNRLTFINNGKWFALIIASVLFGLAHIAGGWVYVFISTIAGLGYGLTYQVTGRIEASIIAHFSVNLIHILLFTYPALIPN